MKAQVLLIGLFVAVVLGLRAWRNSPTIFGRSRTRVNFAARKVPSMIYYYLRVLTAIENPLTFLGCHIRRVSIPGNLVRFRSGVRMKVSDSKDDVATLFCVMVKHDYGAIRAGSTVIDVGANIGAFTVFALESGARVVHSFEPSEGSFNLLRENIRINGMSDRAVCHCLVVSSRSGDRLLFPKSSDPSNSPVAESEAGDCAPVFTISLTDIIAQNGLTHVDYLKLDCEGAEYGIVLDSPPETWNVIDDVKIEYHHGDFQKLIDRLSQFGFTLQSHRVTTPLMGHLWFSRRH